MNSAHALGRRGEDAAVAHLEALGLRVIERNWRCPAGEIDVVADDAGCLVVVEVKTRSTLSHGVPAEAVTARKLARLRRLAARWLAAQDRHWRSVRIDVVSVRPDGGGLAVEHLRGVA